MKKILNQNLSACAFLILLMAGASAALPKIVMAASTSTPAASGLSFPLDITIATRSGHVLEYASAARGDAAPVVDMTGSNTGIFSAKGTALDASGNVYIANGISSVTEYGAGADASTTPISARATGYAQNADPGAKTKEPFSELKVKPSSVTFQEINLANEVTSESKSFSVTDSGTASLTVTIGNPSSSAFTITQGAGQTLLQPKGEMTVKVKFEPSAAGKFHGTIAAVSYTHLTLPTTERV